MTWNVDDDLDGEPGVLRVSASDVASSSECERFMATKVRRFAYGKGWKRRFAPNRHPTPFPLGRCDDDRSGGDATCSAG